MAKKTRQHPAFALHRTLDFLARLTTTRRSPRWSRILYGIIAAATTIAVGLLGLMERACGDEVAEAGSAWLQAWGEAKAFGYRWRLWIAVAFFALQGLFWGLRWIRARLSPIDIERTEDVLEHVRSSYFANPDHEKHKYRATLFKVRGHRVLTRGQWLGIVARSASAGSCLRSPSRWTRRTCKTSPSSK